MRIFHSVRWLARGDRKSLCVTFLILVQLVFSRSCVQVMSDENIETYAPEFWMGGATYRVPMSMHAEQRERIRARMLKKVPASGVLLFQGAISVTRDASDHEPLIRQESFFQYLFGVKEPDCYGLVDLATGKSHLFFPRLPRSYQVWMGRVRSCPFASFELLFLSRPHF